MSQDNNLNQNLMNGLSSSHFDPVSGKMNVGPPHPQTRPNITLSQNRSPTLLNQQANGFDSSHSSRNSSPGSRIQQIPASQLPPSRAPLPQPPNIGVNQLSSSYQQLRISSQVTPGQSPSTSFTTSTPVLNKPIEARVSNPSDVKSISPVAAQQFPASQFTNTLRTQGHNNVESYTSLPQGNIISQSKTESNKPSAGSANNPEENVQQCTANNFVNSPTLTMSKHSAFANVQQLPQNVKMAPNTSSYFSQPLTSDGFKQTAAVPHPNPSVQGINVPNTMFNQNMYHAPAKTLPATNPPFGPSAGMKLQNGPQPNVAQTKPNLLPGNAPNIGPPASLNSYQPQQPAQSQPQSQIPPTNGPNALKSHLHSNRYPTAPIYQSQAPQTMAQQPPLPVPQAPVQQMQQNQYQNPSFNYQQPQQQTLQQTDSRTQAYQQNYSVANAGFNRMWGQEGVDLLQCPNILPPTKVEAPRISLGQEVLDVVNCSPDIFRCTMTKIPETNSLLQKARLPLGVLIHPFKDLDHLPVIQCATIVRCRSCRNYINPFVFFVDTKRWKCNLCYRINELPEEFQYDPVSKTYGDPSRRPEIRSSTIEYIAPSEYMLRPPQPAVYIFLLDVSRLAIESGYLETFCNVLRSNLTNLPGDARTQIGFIAYNSALHFYSLSEGLSQPQEMTVLDIDDAFLPCPDNLVVNLQERMELISDLLGLLPSRFVNSYDNESALGAALQVAHKMIASTGGRITVFQASLPKVGPGALTPREDPSQRAGIDVQHLNPATDFYKRLALECSGQQIAVDLFLINSQYVDLATLSGISRFSGGCMYHFPLYKASRPLQAESLERAFKRYLTRKIGFEAVMRIRCTRGLSIHAFHGNFFVRSTDLLSLPNINPDAGFGLQVSIDESLTDLQSACFQASLLYTSSKGERRIRVHTLCIPVTSTLQDVIHSADQQCIVGLLAKMAVDRSLQSSLSDARDAFINVAIDILSSYKLALNMGSGMSGLLVPQCLKLLPLYISAILKHIAFRSGTSTRLDDRIKAMCDMKTLPLYQLIQQIYPDLYPIHNLEEQSTISNAEGEPIPQPSRLQLTARSLESKGVYLMDLGDQILIFVCSGVSKLFLTEALGVSDYNSITEQMYDVPILETLRNQRLNSFLGYLNEEKPYNASLHIMRDNSQNRNLFIERLIEDRVETALSYHEFLQHLKTQVK